MRRWALLLLVAGCGLDEWPATHETGQSTTTSIGTISALAVGRQNACVVTGDYKLYCWGDNGSGQLGVDPMKTYWSDAGIKNPQITNAVAPAVDDNATICILDGTTSVQCIGSAQALGDGTGVARSTFGPVSLTNVTSLGGGDGFCAASGNTLQCWGGGSPYNPGYLKATPTTVTGPDASHGLFNGEDHGCALDGGYNAWCWGSDAYGQLGDGQCTSTVGGAVRAPSISAFEIGVTQTATCGLAGSGAIACVGAPVTGGGGCGMTSVPFTGVTGAQHIVGGDNFFCTVDMSGAVACWGDNSVGELGTPPGPATATPQTPTGLAPAKLLAAGGAQGCAVTRDDKVFCWGQDNGVARPVTPIAFQN